MDCTFNCRWSVTWSGSHRQVTSICATSYPHIWTYIHPNLYNHTLRLPQPFLKYTTDKNRKQWSNEFVHSCMSDCSLADTRINDVPIYACRCWWSIKDYWPNETPWINCMFSKIVHCTHDCLDVLYALLILFTVLVIFVLLIQVFFLVLS